MPGKPIDRRSFFRHGLRSIVRTVVQTVDAAVGPPGERDALPERFARLRPPGAKAEPDFLAACTRCDDCIQACPAQAITRVPAGHPDAGTPVIRPSIRACVMCTSLSCTRVCEPGALKQLERVEQIAIGIADIDPGTCIAYHGESCTACADICPADPRAISIQDGRPRVLVDPCTGCGLCEERCPTRPRSVRVWPVPPEAESRGA